MQTLSKCPDGLLQGHDISLFQLEKFRFRRDTSNHAIVMKVRKWNVTILIFSIQRSTVRVILLCVTNFLKTLKTSRSWETPCQSISPGENWWVVWSVMHFDTLWQLPVIYCTCVAIASLGYVKCIKKIQMNKDIIYPSEILKHWRKTSSLIHHPTWGSNNQQLTRRGK